METLLRKYLWAIDMAVIALCAIFTARASATFVETGLLKAAPTAKRSARVATVAAQTTVYTKQVDDILKRNIFCSTCPPILQVAAAVGAPPPDPGPQKTSMPLRLLAVMYA